MNAVALLKRFETNHHNNNATNPYAMGFVSFEKTAVATMIRSTNLGFHPDV